MVVVACPNSSLVEVHIDPDRIPSSSKHDYASAYARIRSAARTAGPGVSSVLILSSPDVDSVCATRILTSLLLQDDIPHRIVPVEGYRSLLSTLSTVFPPLEEDAPPRDASSSSSAATTDVRSVIFLNLGAVLSLPTTFNIPASCTIHVIDSHRPWNLENLFATSHANDRVWCWDDGEIATKLCRQGGERDAFEKLEFDVDSDSEDDSDDEDSASESAHSDDDDDDDDDQQAGSARGKRKRSSRSPSGKRRHRHRSTSPNTTSSKLTNAERHRYRTVLTRYYNRGESFGMSVSSMLYLLCESLGRADRESLWLAIVGLTSLYLSNSIDFETYETYSSAYASEVIATEPTSSAGPTEAWSLDLLAKDSADDESRKATAASRANDRALRSVISHNTKSEDADDRSIRIIPSELRFTLYRHWSLETAMYHTAYVAAKLGIWRERGLSKLRGLMAKMGFSLTAVRQNYTHMPLDLRRSLVRKLQAIAPEYGLTQLTYRGFERSLGFRTAPLGAADVVEGVSALLVAAHGVKIEVETPGMVFASAGSTNGAPLGNSFAANLNPANPHAQTSELFATKRIWNLGTALTDTITSAIAAATSSTGKDQTGANAGLDLDLTQNAPASAEDLAALEGVERKVATTNFYEAYRALDFTRATSVDLLRSSLLLSQALHRKIVARGISLITNQSIRTLKNFRLAILKDGVDLELFTHVEVLSRLADWLTTSLRDIIVEQQTAAAAAAKKKRSSAAAAAAAGVYAPLPFILAALHPAKDSFLVLGSTGSAVEGMVENNHFTSAFQQAAKMSGARVRHDRFQTFSIQVRKADLAGFVEKVHLKIK